MTLTLLDYGIILAYVLVVLVIGLMHFRKAGSSVAEYFASGRSLPWWLAGTSMVATTFAADTPLVVVKFTAQHGLAGNWVWWAMAVSGMVTVFLYAQLWRRAEVLTDVELIPLRYGGKAAVALRYVRALYVALVINPIIIGWVVKAMLKVLGHTVFLDAQSWGPGVDWSWVVILVMMALVGFYATMSGMWGVALADVVQFVLAMLGCIWLAVVATHRVGGVQQLQEKVIQHTGNPHAFDFLPSFGEGPTMAMHVFLLIIGMQWWASWYPGSEPGGGGYVVQRMASSKDERHAMLATWWFQVANYCLRPWPWLIVGFAALAYYPDFAKSSDLELGFPMIMRDFSPPGLRGLMLVVFFAAFMSTISTQMNWGASYLVNDFILPVFYPNSADKPHPAVYRWTSVVVILLGIGVAYWMNANDVKVDQAWKLLLSLGAGTGLVFMLRWYWWRINAWSEISAMVASLVFFMVFASSTFNTYWLNQFGREMDDEVRMALVAIPSILVWLIVTYLTPAESEEKLLSFFRKVRPYPVGWRRVAQQAPEVPTDNDLGLRILCAVLGVTTIYTILPGTGYLLFGQYQRAAIVLSVAVVCSVALYWLVTRLNRQSQLRQETAERLA